MSTKPPTVQVSKRVATLYIALALILIPWASYLGYTLPEHHLSAHWDISWVGLDVFIAAALSTTGILTYRQSPLVVLSATAAGTALLVDAWFDVMSERRSSNLHQAIILALAVEIPLALLSFRLAQRVLKGEKPSIAELRERQQG